jgi:hypothetical protein
MTTTAVATDVIARAVELACRAPSLHNSQPWRWVATPAAVDLFTDLHRVVRSTDSSGREAIISCGAVLDHFRTATAAHGWRTQIEEFPNPNRLEHLASIYFTPLEYVTQSSRDRADAISRRRSDRLPFGPPRDWQSFETTLRIAFGSDLVAVEVLADSARLLLLEASRLTESLRRDDDYYHRELHWWTAPFRISEGYPRVSWCHGQKLIGWEWTEDFLPVALAIGTPPPRRTKQRYWCCPPRKTPTRTRSMPAKCYRRCCWSARSPDSRLVPSRTSRSWRPAGTSSEM